MMKRIKKAGLGLTAIVLSSPAFAVGSNYIDWTTTLDDAKATSSAAITAGVVIFGIITAVVIGLAMFRKFRGR